MATKTTTTRISDADATGRGAGRRMAHRHVPFSSLMLGVVVHVVAAVAVRFVLVLRHATWPAYASVVAGVVVATTLLAVAAWGAARKRDAWIRWHLVVTVVAAGVAMAIPIAIGWPVWWAWTYALGGPTVALSWALYRLDATRHDSKEEGPKEDGLRKDLGLEKIKFSGAQVHRDATGEATRIEVKATPSKGATVKDVRDALAGLEVEAKAPPGLSRAVANPRDASDINVTLILKDALATSPDWPGLSSPGGCITEPLVTGVCEDQVPAEEFIVLPGQRGTNRGTMGVTGAGKSVHDQISTAEILSRRNAAVLWFDQVKGMQTAGPLIPGLTICSLLTNDEDRKTYEADVKQAFAAFKALITYRVDLMGRHGYDKWTPEVFEKLGLRYLVWHFEEADTLVKLVPSSLIYVASKGLSAGCSTEINLQRADDAAGTPSQVRFNITSWACFGCGDSYSAGFALGDDLLDQCANPGDWKAFYPGRNLYQGIGVPPERWPITRKTFNATGTQIRGAMEYLFAGRGPAQLTPGEAAAMGDWYARALERTAELRTSMALGPASEPSGMTPAKAPTSANTAPTPAVARVKTDDDDGFTGDDDADYGDDEERFYDDEEDDDMTTTSDEEDEERARGLSEIEEMRASGEIPLSAEARDIDPTQPVPAPEDDGTPDLSWGQDKSEAPTREAAYEMFGRALAELARVGTELVTPTLILRHYPFRSAPWFSDALTDAAEGELDLAGLRLERTGRAGEYRLQRVASVTQLRDAQ